MRSVDIGEYSTIDGWMEYAIAKIDEIFGDDYARNNPALVGAYIQACAIASLRTAVTDDLANSLSDLRGSVSRP
jgi:hypothetical protein